MMQALDQLMESASQALAGLEYAKCEAKCLEALQAARDAGDWVMVKRVLLPLQEARRQKRQLAIDGQVLLGWPREFEINKVTDWLPPQGDGCIVVTEAHDRTLAMQIDECVRQAERCVEVLWAWNPSDAETWTITTYRNNSPVRADVPAPPKPWIGSWMSPLSIAPPTPAHWFMRANEALGDAAIAAITSERGTVEYFDDLAEALSLVGDHEILHQRLADAAQALHEAQR